MKLINYKNPVTPETNWAVVGVRVKVVHIPPTSRYFSEWPPVGTVLTIRDIKIHPRYPNWKGLRFVEYRGYDEWYSELTFAIFDPDLSVPCFEPVDE